MGFWYFSFRSILPFVVCFFFYLFRIIGAGDIKLFSIISSYFNFKLCVQVMIVSVVIGAIFSLAKMLYQRSFMGRFQYFWQYMRELAAEKKWKPYYDLNIQGEEGVIPFTICISLATIMCAGR